MTEFRRGAFWRDLSFAGLRIAKAWDMLHQPAVTQNLDAEAYMDLCRDAGMSEESIQKAGTRRANARLDRGLTP